MTPIERAGYLAYARSAGFARRVAAAGAVIAAHPDYAVACSWGKDSTALLHLAWSARPGVAAINARYSDAERLPDTDAVRDAALARLPGLRYAEASLPGEWEMYERAGGFFMDATNAAERAAVAWWRARFVAGMGAAAGALGASGTFLGLRADESRARRLNLATHGDSYTRRGDGQAVALPLARWSARDVWAYLVLHGLPWLRMYDAAQDRERARSAFCFATGGAGAIWRHGAWEEWRAAYPDHFAAWPRRFPEMARYR